MDEQITADADIDERFVPCCWHIFAFELVESPGFEIAAYIERADHTRLRMIKDYRQRNRSRRDEHDVGAETLRVVGSSSLPNHNLGACCGALQIDSILIFRRILAATNEILPSNFDYKYPDFVSAAVLCNPVSFSHSFIS